MLGQRYEACRRTVDGVEQEGISAVAAVPGSGGSAAVAASNLAPSPGFLDRANRDRRHRTQRRDTPIPAALTTPAVACGRVRTGEGGGIPASI
jgi:hypothetical protein